MIVLDEIVYDSFGNNINLWKLETDNSNIYASVYNISNDDNNLIKSTNY